MKKIQCEVCGSTEIKKVGDDLFECQSCGVQYSKNDVSKLLVEIKGEVKIDHTEDVENLTKRAERFYEDGDTDRAIEYYERVLDADPDNEKAQDRLDEIAKEQELESAFKDVYAFDANTTKEECVNNFFMALQSQKNIAHTIYKEISIDDVTEMYYPFTFMKASGTLDWSAIRCDEYFENQTVYKREYNSDKKQWEQVPKTERVVKVNRTPVNGREDWSDSRLVLATKTIEKAIKCNSAAKSIIKKVEGTFDDGYSSDNLIKLEAKLLEDTGETAFYKEIPICIDMDSELVKSKMQNMLSSARNTAESIAARSAGGNYVENMNSRFYVSKNTWVSIFIPICIINYTYKNQKFSAVIDMSKNYSFMEMVYPIEKELFESNKETEELTKKKLNVIPGLGIMACGFIIGVIMIQIDNKMGYKAPDGLVIGGIVFMILGLIGGIIDLIVRSISLKNKQVMATEKNANLMAPRKTYLEKTAAKFINGYSNYDNLSNVQGFLPKSDDEVLEIMCSESITVKNKKSKKYVNKEDENNKNQIKKLASENKMEAIKKYIELYGVGLAEAKEAVDKIAENDEYDNASDSNSSTSYDNENDEILGEIKKLASENKIEAIKKYCETFNVNLKEAKEAVDQMLF
ncbi:MAG: tetratricopeptide repeat protein [Eubacterium sp.]|nr:tetratricopeptide repeat protein [Eubacterium sp.]